MGEELYRRIYNREEKARNLVSNALKWRNAKCYICRKKDKKNEDDNSETTQSSEHNKIPYYELSQTTQYGRPKDDCSKNSYNNYPYM